MPFRDKTAETKQVTLVALVAAAEPELELRGLTLILCMYLNVRSEFV